MKGTYKFATQKAAMVYYTLLVNEVASKGWFRTDEVKKVFANDLKSIKTKDNFLAGGQWQLICLPILSFFQAVSGGGGSMLCDFKVEVSVDKESDLLSGTLAWYGQATRGRFVEINFRKDGTAMMKYNTGYRWDGEMNKYLPKGYSRLLGMPWKKGKKIEAAYPPREEEVKPVLMPPLAEVAYLWEDEIIPM